MMESARVTPALCLPAAVVPPKKHRAGPRFPGPAGGQGSRWLAGRRLLSLYERQSS